MTCEEALRELPTLTMVLGKKWIERESATPPLESAFPLARRLRIKELRPLHATVDRRRVELWTISGVDNWRNRLRPNGQDFREPQIALAFASFLQQFGYDVARPKEGADFAIVLGDEPPPMIEAPWPRNVM